MCTTPKSSKAAKPRSSGSAVSPPSFQTNLAAMQGTSNQFDEFDRDEEQFRLLAEGKKQDSADSVTKKSSNKSSKTGSWMVQFRGFWGRLFH